MEKYLDGIENMPAFLECPTGAKCQLPFKIPAVNLTLANTIDVRFGHRVKARRDPNGEAVPTAAALQPRVAAIEAKASTDVPTRRRLQVSSLSVGACILLAFFAGRSTPPADVAPMPPTSSVWPGPSSPEHLAQGVGGSFYWTDPTLFEWAQAWDNRRLLLWQMKAQVSAPVLMEARIRYGWWLPQVSYPPSYIQCVSAQSEFEFWAKKLFFPHECATEVAQEAAEHIDAPWTVWLYVMSLKCDHIARMSTAVMPFNLDPENRHRRVLGTVQFTIKFLAFVFGAFLNSELNGICHAATMYNVFPLLATLFFFVPNSWAYLFLRFGVLSEGCARLCKVAITVFTTVTNPRSHKLMFFSAGLLVVAQHYKLIHSPVLVAVTCCLLVYRIRFAPIWTT